MAGPSFDIRQQGDSFAPLTSTQAKPTQLGSPIPGQQQQLDAVEDVVEAAPEAGLQAVPEAPADEFADFDEPDEFADFGTLPVPPEPLAPTEPLGFGQRLALGFATTPTEEANLLGRKFGKDNARVKDGVAQFRKNPQSKFVDADPDELELGDIADLSRFATEIGIELPFALGGAALGTLAGPGGTVAGGIAGASVGSGIATSLGDVIAEQFLGIERDPERLGKLSEAALAVGLGAAFGGAGAAISKRLAARKVAKVLARGEVDSKQADIIIGEIVESIEGARKSGLVKSVDGTEIVLAPQQVVPGEIATGATVDAIELAGEQGFKNFQNAQGQMIREGFEALQQAVGRETGKNTKGLASTFIKSVDEINRNEGALIGEFRKRAGKLFKNDPAPLATSGQLLADLGKELGANVNQLGKITGLDVENLSEKLVTPKTGPLVEFSKVLRELGEGSLNKGGISPDRMGANVDRLKKIIQATGGSKGAVGVNPQANLNVAAKQLASTLRSDWREAVRLAMPTKELADEYTSSLLRFGKLRDSMDKLKNILKDDDISREALVKDVFSKGKQGLPRIRAVKNIIQDADPALWGDLVGENIERLLKDATDPVTKVTDFNKVVKQLDGLGEEAKEEIFGGSGFNLKQVNQFFKVAQAASKGRVETVTARTAIGFAQSVGEMAGSPFWRTRINALRRIVSFATKEKDLAKLLTPEAVQKAIMSVKPAQRGPIRQAFDTILGGAVAGAGAVARPLTSPTAQRALSREAIRGE